MGISVDAGLESHRRGKMISILVLVTCPLMRKSSIVLMKMMSALSPVKESQTRWKINRMKIQG